VITKEYRDNRARFPRAEILKHQGSWAAFSADGCRIVASGTSVEQLETKLAENGNGQNVVLEWLPGPEDDSYLGSGDVA